MRARMACRSYERELRLVVQLVPDRAVASSGPSRRRPPRRRRPPGVPGAPRRRRVRRRRSRRGCRGRSRAGRPTARGWISLVSASTRNAWILSPSRRNRVFASEQSPQKTPARWRSTRSQAIASRSRSRYGPGPSGNRIRSRRYWIENSRYSVIEDRGVALGRRRQADRGHGGQLGILEVSQHVELGLRDAEGLLLERVRPPVLRPGTGRDGARAPPAGRGTAACPRSTRPAVAPRAGRAAPRRYPGGGAGETTLASSRRPGRLRASCEGTP